MSNTFQKICSVVSVFLLTAIFAFGQATTGSIDGTVKDANGAVVPGASVTVTGISTGFTQTLTTNSDGYYRIDRVPAGSFKVTVGAINGFVAKTVETNVNIEKTSTVDVSLSTQVSADVVVSGDPLGVSIDTSDSKTQTNVTEELIEKLPLGNNFSSILKLNPATRGENLTGGFTVAGASKAENTFSIDGQDVTNARYGTLNDNSTGIDSNNIPTAMIKEVQIKTAGFEAEHGGASGGVVTIATKSGTDKFHGEAGAQFTTSKLQPNNNPGGISNTRDVGFTAQRLFTLPPSPKDASLSFNPTLSVGGPILKKRLWFFGVWSPQKYEATRTTTYYSYNPDGSGRLISDPKIGTLYYPTTPTEIYNLSQTQEFGQARLDYSITNNLSGFSSYLWNPFRSKGGFPYGSIAIDSVEPFVAGYPTGPGLYAKKGGFSGSELFNTQLTWTPFSWLAINGRFGYGFQNEKPGSYANGDGLQFQCLGVSGSTPYTTGIAGCQRNFLNQTTTGGIVRNVTKRRTYNFDGTLFFNAFGRHNLKIGYEQARIGVDILESTANYVQMYYGQASTTGGCPTAALTAGTCLGFGYAILYGEGARGGNKAQGFFVQDKWNIGRLTLNVGVRAEAEKLPAFTSPGTTAKSAPITLGWGDKVVPRLGAAYDLFGDGKTRIYGSFGVFSDRMKFEMPIGSFGGAYYYEDYFPIQAAHPNYSYYTRDKFYGTYNPFVNSTTTNNPSMFGGIVVRHRNYRPDSSIGGCYTAATGVNPSGTCAQQGVAGGLTLVGVDPNLKPFQQRAFTLGFETELWNNYVLGANYNNRSIIHTIDDVGYGGDSYYTIGNPSEGLAESQALAQGYGPSAKPTRKYNAVELSFTRRFANHYFYSANYTWSRLFGNYSGLANSDYWDGGSLSGNRGDRSSPGVNRFYDWSVAGYSAHGGRDDGVLGTDRTHVFKAYGGYGFDWFGSKTNETMLSFFQVIQSGTPQTTVVEVIEGSQIWIPYTKRNDIGRTPTYTQTDLTLAHTYKFGNDGRFKVVGDITVNNLFNQHVVTAINPRRWIQDGLPSSLYEDSPAFEKMVQAGTLGSAYDSLNCTSTAACAAVGVIPNTADGSNMNLLYKQPSAFQFQRNIRFGFRFVF